jgi:hypothetical protein
MEKPSFITDFFKRSKSDFENNENISCDENIKKLIALLACQDGLSFQQISS